jgi:hypothetical protein
LQFNEGFKKISLSNKNFNKKLSNCRKGLLPWFQGEGWDDVNIAMTEDDLKEKMKKVRFCS